MLLFLGLDLGARACDLPALSGALDQAEDALTVLDIATFQAAAARAEELLACLQEPLPRHEAARLHRVVGLRAFGAREPLSAAAFAAARRIEPGYVFPRSLVPKGSPVVTDYESLALEGLALRALPVPAEGWIQLDGAPTLEHPEALPVVFQQFSGDGAVATTRYLLPGDAPPAYVEAPEGGEMIPGIVIDPGPTWWQRQTVPLVVATGASAALTATLWGLSRHGRARYLEVDADPVADAELDALRARTNALAVGSGLGLGLTGVSGLLLMTTMW